jgi:hypothetical protein
MISARPRRKRVLHATGGAQTMVALAVQTDLGGGFVPSREGIYGRC